MPTLRSLSLPALLACLAASCTPPPPSAAPCNDDSECQSGERCQSGRCATAPLHEGLLDDAGEPPPDTSAPVDAAVDASVDLDAGTVDAAEEPRDAAVPSDAATSAPDGGDDDAGTDAGLDSGVDAGEPCSGGDEDGDGVPDSCDNCPGVANPGQEDVGELDDGSAPDGVGDACDPRPADPGDAIAHFDPFDDLSAWNPVNCTWTVANGQVTQSDGLGAKNCRMALENGVAGDDLLIETRMRVLTFDDPSTASAGAMVSLVENDAWLCSVHVNDAVVVWRVASGGAQRRGRAPFPVDPGVEATVRMGGDKEQALCSANGQLVYQHVGGDRDEGRVALRTNDATAVYSYVTVYRLGGDIEGPEPPDARHRYSFNGPSDALLVEDLQGAADGVMMGDATLSGTALVVEGAGTGYVDLPNGMLSSLNAVTIEAWVTWDGPNAGGGFWQHLFDFGTSTAGELTDVEGPDAGTFTGEGVSALMFTPSTGEDEVYTRLRDADGDDVFVMTTGALPVGSQVHVALSYDPDANRAALYVQGGMKDFAAGAMPLSELDDVNCWIGRSGWVNDERFDGAVNEFRIYGRALTPLEVLGSFQGGPNP